MSDVPEKITTLIRMAIWEAHGRRCVYENIPITWDAVQIDHILPKSLWRDATKKAQAFKALELPHDLLPDDLGNLIPCRTLRNGQKSDWVFEQSSVRFFRQLAEEKRGEVKRWIARLNEQQVQDRIRSSAEAACDANPELKAKLMAALAVTEPYKTEDVVSADKVLFSRPRVRLECNLPRDESYGDCLININTLYLHRVQITLDGRQIVSPLLHGSGYSLDPKQRAFVVGPRTDQPDEWIVRIAGATIFLTKEELRQLCDVVDRLAPHFLKALLDREVTEGTLAFAPDGPNNVRLLTIKRPLWAAILEFAGEHDYADGSSPWHIFDAGGHGHIKMVRRTPEGNVIPFEAYIYPTADEIGLCGPMTEPEDDVCLCWNSQFSCLSENPQGPSCNGWSAEFTHHWLVNKLIPEVIRNLPRENESLLERFRQWAFSDGSPEYFSNTEGLDPAVFRPVQDWPALIHFIGLAQRHYNSHPADPIARPAIVSALSVLAMLADALTVSAESLSYYSGKMGVRLNGGMRELVIEAIRKNEARAYFDGFDLDNILRCVGGVLSSHAPNAGKQSDLLAKISQAILPLAETFRWDAIRARTLKRIEHRSAQDYL